MKKLLYSLLILSITTATAFASSENVKVEAVSDFSTAHPAQKIDVKVVNDSTLGTHTLKEGDIIHCKVVKVTDPKRGKRAASFAVCPISYTSEGHTTTINENYYGKYTEKVMSKEQLKNVDPVKVGKKAAISVGNHFVKGVAPAVYLAEGMIKNEDGNRIESGVKTVYKNSPLCYVEKGQEINIKPGQEFYLTFKPSKSKNTEDIAEEVLEEE